MTGDLRSESSRTEPDVRLKVHRPDEPDRDTGAADTIGTEIPWPESDPDDPLEPSGTLDAEITAAAKALFFNRDLVRPGPGLLPFGSRARDRRKHRCEVDATAAARRAELAELLTARRNSPTARSHGPVRSGHPRMVAALLTAVVIAIAAAGWWMSLSTTPAVPAQDLVDTGSGAADLPSYESDSTTLAATTPTTLKATTATAVGLTSPEAAAGSWLAAWCRIDSNLSPEAVVATTREAMTAAGWAQFTGTSGPTLADAVPGVTATCDTPSARIVSHPPGTDLSVVVLVSATRTVTDTKNPAAARRFRIERRQYVVRGDDGLWRVDVAAVGG